MTEPRRPRAIVSNPAEAWRQFSSAFDIASIFASPLRGMTDLSNPERPRPGLIDHVAPAYTLAHEIRIPASLPSGGSTGGQAPV